MKALGRHVIVEFYQCSASKLNDVEYLEQNMVLAAHKTGATVINSTFHHFHPLGVSGVVVIQESHFAIHTWPEYGFASLDIFTCGDSVDPWIAYHLIKEAIEAEYGSATEMGRGHFNLLEKNGLKVSSEEHYSQFDQIQAREFPLTSRAQHQPDFLEPEKLGQDQSGKNQIFADISSAKLDQKTWFTECNQDIAFSFRHTGKVLHKQKTPYQNIKIYESRKFGNTLVLDDLIMCTEKDESIYHEMITHVPMLTHPDPQSVLIIGGGDGGVARELVKHQAVAEVTLVEIDQGVIEAARKYLPTIAAGLDHPKVTIKIADGIEYIRAAADATFDLVIVDSTDPVGPAVGLFNHAFYQQVYRCLKPQGILVTQSESPLFNAEVFQEISRCHKEIFGAAHVHCYLAAIPTYPMGIWGFSYASRGTHPLKDFDPEEAKKFTQRQRLMYYNEEIHRAAFALPTFVKRMLEPEEFT